MNKRAKAAIALLLAGGPTAGFFFWKLPHWAWYVQLRDGAPAAIAALQQVQGEIVAAGVSNPKLAQTAARRMEEWHQQLPRSGGNR